jgi:hypothetical protein
MAKRKKIAEVLTDDNDNNNNTGTGTDTGTDTGTGTELAVNTDADSNATGGTNSDSEQPINTSSESTDGLPEFALTSPVATDGDNGTEQPARRRRRRRSTNGTDSGDSATGTGTGTRRRNTASTAVNAGTPLSVKGKEVLEGLKGKDGVQKLLLSGLLGTTFQLPALAGFGAHWELDREELTELTNVTNDFINSLPSSKRKTINALLSQYVPSINLVATLGVIIYTKVQQTKEMRLNNAITQETADYGNTYSNPANTSERFYQDQPVDVNEQPTGASNGASRETILRNVFR